MANCYAQTPEGVMRESSIRSVSSLTAMRVALILILNFAILTSAFAFSNSPECKVDLRSLIVSPLTHVVMDKSIIQAEIADSSNGIYSARLFVPADSPDNVNKQVSIGWVNLDVNSMKAYDVTDDQNNTIEFKINRNLYKKYVDKCILGARKEDVSKMSCGALRSTAEKSEILIPGDDSGREVIGSGRLQFYSAPDAICEISGVFILPKEKVEAHSEYGDYTSVDYTNLKTGSNASGWVRSSRLRPTGLGIAPHQ